MIGKNNPFNVRYSASNKWIGLVGNTRGFCDFSYVDYGIRAAAILILRTYRKNNVLTISELVHRWAPSSENNTDAYIRFLCYSLGVFPFDVPKDLDEYVKLLYYISVYEGNKVEPSEILRVCKEFKITPYVRRKKRV